MATLTRWERSIGVPRKYLWLILLIIFGIFICGILSESVSKEEAKQLRDEVCDLYYAFDGYIKHAFPHDELMPLSCGGEDTLGGYALTLVNSSTINVYGWIVSVVNCTQLFVLLRLIPWTHWLCFVIRSASAHLLNGLVKIFDLILLKRKEDEILGKLLGDLQRENERSKSLEPELPPVSDVQVEPIVLQVDRLDLVLEENDDADASSRFFYTSKADKPRRSHDQT